MSCRPPLDYALYAGSAMPPDEARAFEDHLRTCAACRSVLDLRRAEDRALSAALHAGAAEAPAWTPKPLVTPAALLRNVAAAAAVFFLPGRLISRQTVLRFAVPALIEHSQIAVAAFAVLLAIASVAWVLGLRRVRGLAGVLVLLAMIAPVHAITTRTGGPIALVPSGETVRGSLFAAGDIVRVEGVIAGDLFAFARRVEIHGTVRGNLYAFAKEIEITGTVQHGLYACGEAVNLASGGTVSGGLVAAAGALAIRGSVGKFVRFYGEQLDVADSARVAGPVAVDVDDRRLVHVPAAIPVIIEDERGRFQDPSFYVGRLAKFAIALLVALIVVRLSPMFVEESLIAAARWWRSLAAGIAVATTGAVLTALAAASLIGIPVAGLLVLLFTLAIYGAKLLIGNFAGRVLLPGRRPPVQLACGLALVFAAIELPFGIGSAMWAAIVLAGLGAFTFGARRYYVGTVRY